MCIGLLAMPAPALAEQYLCTVAEIKGGSIPTRFEVDISENGKEIVVLNSNEYMFRDAVWKKRLFGGRQKVKFIGRSKKKSWQKSDAIRGLEYRLDLDKKTGEFKIQMFLQLAPGYSQRRPSFATGRCTTDYIRY